MRMPCDCARPRGGVRRPGGQRRAACCVAGLNVSATADTVRDRQFTARQERKMHCRSTTRTSDRGVDTLSGYRVPASGRAVAPSRQRPARWMRLDSIIDDGHSPRVPAYTSP
eukprot:3157595-Prymnesium_polylepis.2